jgi:hypothetical protein
MMTGDRLAQLSSGERSEWLQSLSDDEALVAYTPVGYRYTLVVLSEAKRSLLADLPPEYRLKILEHLDRRTDTFTAEAIAQIEPMCDEAYEIFKEAQKLGASKALDVFARWEVFNAFAALNPSLLTAIEMSGGREHQSGRRKLKGK